MRINREEKEKGKTTQQTVQSFRQRLGLAFGNDGGGKVEVKKEG